MVYVATATEASPRLGRCAVLRSEIKGKRVAWQGRTFAEQSGALAWFCGRS